MNEEREGTPDRTPIEEAEADTEPGGRINPAG